jgi:hypothetical protein
MPGVFMRASVPSDRMSWKQKMHVVDTEAMPTRIISHATLRSSSMPLYALNVARVSADVLLYLSPPIRFRYNAQLASQLAAPISLRLGKQITSSDRDLHTRSLNSTLSQLVAKCKR